MDPNKLTLDLEQHVDINRPIADTFEGLLQGLGEKNKTPDGKPMNLVIERKPGGRWFRDMGNDVGYHWGFVQVIKPPTLLELYGPMFMSYPAANHIECKLTEIPGGTRITLRHRAIGLLDPAHCEGVSKGWGMILDRMKQDLES